jgi:hypothetical protein
MGFEFLKPEHRMLGADHVPDYKGEDFTEGRRRYELRNFVCGVNTVGSGGPPELLSRTDGKTCAAE